MSSSTLTYDKIKDQTLNNNNNNNNNNNKKKHKIQN